MFVTARKAVLLVFAFLLLTSVAVAQNNRSAVSVTGSDATACTVPDPCRTFGVAQSKTNPGGEIVALTSGGYGPFTIDKSVTVVAAPGIYAALVAAPAGNAIFVNAGAGAKVVIRGLHLYGMGTGATGIDVTAPNASDEVHIEKCVIDGFTSAGVNARFNVRISDTIIRNGGTGIFINSPFGAVKGTINRVEVRDGADGISVATAANVTVRDSRVSSCSGIGFVANDNGQLNIENSLSTNNGVGIQTFSASATIRVSNTLVTDNGTGLSNATGATMISWGNNKVQGNATNKSGTITVVTQD